MLKEFREMTCLMCNKPFLTQGTTTKTCVDCRKKYREKYIKFYKERKKKERELKAKNKASRAEIELEARKQDMHYGEYVARMWMKENDRKRGVK